MFLLKSADSFIPIICFLLCTSGPTPNISWTSIGPGGGGWLSTITVVNDAANTIYVGCDVGGIYKSTDHGQTWTIKDKGLSIYYVQDIAYDPGKPTTLYAATRGGVYKSINGGDSWRIKRSGFPPESDYHFSAPISDIVVDPVHPNIIYAGVGVVRPGYILDSYHWQSAGIKGAIYKSTNYGESWSLIRNKGIDLNAMIFSLAISPDNSNILYASTSAGIYKSTDAGASWVSKNSGLPHTLAMKLVINPANTNILYVTMWAEPGSSSWQGGVYKSINGGNSWVAKNTGLPQQVNDNPGFTSNFPLLVIDKNNPQTLYVGNTPWTPDPGVYKTIDGGNHWTWVSHDDPIDPQKNVNVGWIDEHGVSVKALAIDPIDSDRLYFGTSVHLIKTENAGMSWDQAYTTNKGSGYWQGNGLETTVVGDVAVDPLNSNNVYVGYWDIGFLKSNDGGVSFKKSTTGMEYSSNTFAIIVDPADPSVIYAASGWWEENKGAVFKSTNYGDSWIKLGTGLPDAQVWSIALDENSPVNSRTLYATSYNNGVYKSTDGGQHWVGVNNGLGVNGNLQVRKIAIDPNDSNILYAGFEAKQIESGNSNSTIQGGLFKSVNAGGQWTRIDTSLPQATVWDIDFGVAADNTTIVYTAVKSVYDHTLQVDFSGGVYKSMNEGTSWQRVSNGFGSPENLEVSSIAVSPVDTNTIYAVTTDDPYHDRSEGRGIFKSTNAGANWISVSSETNVKYYESITIDPTNPSVIYAGSSGNGLLKGMDKEAAGYESN